jgi:hypothetical protein
MKTPISKMLMLSLAIGLTFSACRKNKDEDILDKDTSSASDNAFAENTYNDVNNMADEAAKGNLSSYVIANSSDDRNMLSTCATITRDTTVSPRLITIDFGASNCLCSDGRYRRGKVLVSYLGRYKDSASVHTITFNNYFVNDNQILGTKTVTNNGHNPAGHLNWSVQVNGQIIKASNGGTVTWTSSRNREMIAGELTTAWNDDVYLITGSANGTNAAGNNFSAIITTALRREIGCRHFVSGVIQFTPSGKPTRIIDFGNGACDNLATVTINGNTYNITLH